MGGQSFLSCLQLPVEYHFGRGWIICWWGWGGGGGCDCCLCDCGTEKAVSILGLNCKAFTSAWLGGRPPAIWAPQICRLLAAAGRSWRSFAPPSWVHAIDATSFCYPLLLLHPLLVLLFISVTVTVVFLMQLHKGCPVSRRCNRRVCSYAHHLGCFSPPSHHLYQKLLEELCHFLTSLVSVPPYTSGC